MNRRELIQRVLIGSTVLLVVPSVLESCKKTTLTPDPVTGGGPPTAGAPLTVDLSLPGNSALNTVGNYKVVNGVIIINTSAGFVALSSICTHLKCIVAYDSPSGNIKCPCHGSEFTTTGSVVTGPAASPLRKYTVTLENTILTVTS